MKTKLSILFLLFVSAFLFSCAGSSSLMKDAVENESTFKAGTDESVVVFMRPSGTGFAIQSSVFKVGPEGEEFVGIVPAKKKVVFRTSPGKHTFMIVGESADFLQAELEAGKTYYALITPRMGVWKARFSLAAVHKNVDKNKLKSWTKGCKLVENKQDAYGWAKRNAKDIQNKHKKYYAKWSGKAEKNKPILHPEDGF